jgi:hypothetical protein
MHPEVAAAMPAPRPSASIWWNCRRRVSFITAGAGRDRHAQRPAASCWVPRGLAARSARMNRCGRADGRREFIARQPAQHADRALVAGARSSASGIPTASRPGVRDASA